jgi:hypothetical protein
MNSRRGLLKMILGAGVSAPMIGSAGAAKALGVPLFAQPGPSVHDLGTTGSFAPEPLGTINGFPLWKLRRKADYQRQALNYLPAHIASKRSWSPIYKAGEYAREQMIIDAYFDRMEGDKSFAADVARALGLVE